MSVNISIKISGTRYNINLILFHPTVSRKALITTVEKTVNLLSESLRYRAKMSVNSFPLIEAYAGAPINEVADRMDWPRVTENIHHRGKDWQYTVSYLPANPDMRKVVENETLLKEFNAIMDELARDPRWPSATVSRSIGVNGLAMFMAAYNILGITKPESTVSVEDMRQIIWGLIDKFHYVDEAARFLSTQNANVVFAYHEGRYIFRRGSMPLVEVSSVVTEALGAKSPEETLICFRNSNHLDIEEALQDVLFGEVSNLQEAFMRRGITAYNYPNFKKILLVSPCRNADGTPLKTAVPHPGLERISYYVLRNTSDADCRVFNPNLTGRDSMARLIEGEYFDVIGFSFLPPTLANDAPLIDYVAEKSPSSLLVAGGINIRRLPHHEIFGVIPFDALIAGPGEVIFCKMIENLPPSSADLNKNAKVEKLTAVPNFCIYHAGRIIRTPDQPYQFVTIPEGDLRQDISYTYADVTHGIIACTGNLDTDIDRQLEVTIRFLCLTLCIMISGTRYSYGQTAQAIHGTVLPYESIGTRRLYLKMQDTCKGRCIFCSAPREKLVPEKIDVIIQAIKDNLGDFDSIHISDNNLIGNRDTTIRLCNRIIEEGLQDIPKACKGRTDEVDEEIIDLLYEAGFRLLGLGVESFDDRILAEVLKDTTSEINNHALNMVIARRMKPGLDLIFFSPWETVATLAHTIDKCLEYVENGAYLNISPSMYVQLGDFFSRTRRYDIAYQTVFFRSTGKVFYNPERIILSAEMERLRTGAMERLRILEETTRRQSFSTHHGFVSGAVWCLLFCKAIYETLQREDFGPNGKRDNGMAIEKIDKLVARTISLETHRTIVLGSDTPCIICGANPVFFCEKLLDKYYRRFVRCPNCGLIYVCPQPSIESLRQMYGSNYFASNRSSIWGYSDYLADKDIRLNHQTYFLDLLEKATQGRGRLLDVGPAFGYFMQIALERGWQVEGIDMSEFAGQKAYELFGLNILCGTDVRSGSFAPDSFKAVTLFDVLEHFLDPCAELIEINRILANGGVILMKVPIENGKITKPEELLAKADHLFYFNEQALNLLLEQTGFVVVETTQDPFSRDGAQHLDIIARKTSSPPADRRR